jgi:hypothetical protein
MTTTDTLVSSGSHAKLGHTFGPFAYILVFFWVSVHACKSFGECEVVHSAKTMIS